jgi:hypothetical protein
MLYLHHNHLQKHHPRNHHRRHYYFPCRHNPHRARRHHLFLLSERADSRAVKFDET